MQEPGWVRRPLRQCNSARRGIPHFRINESLTKSQQSSSGLTKTFPTPSTSSSTIASEGSHDNCADQGGIVRDIDRLLRTFIIPCRSEDFTGPDDRPLGVEAAIHEYERGECSTSSMDPGLTPLHLRPHTESKVDALRLRDICLPRRNAREPGQNSRKSSTQSTKVGYAAGLVQQEQDESASSQPMPTESKIFGQGPLLEQNHTPFLDLASEDSLAHSPFLMERKISRELTSPTLTPVEGIPRQRPLPPEWIEILRAAIPQAHHLAETDASKNAYIHPALREAAYLPDYCPQEDPFGSCYAHKWDADRCPRLPPTAASLPPTPQYGKQWSRQSTMSSLRSPSRSLLRRRYSLFTSASAYELERDHHPSQDASSSAAAQQKPYQASGCEDEDIVEGTSSNLGSFSSISSFLAYNSFSGQPLCSSSTTAPRSSMSSISTDHLCKQQSVDGSMNSSRIGRISAQPDPNLQRVMEGRSSLQMSSLPDTSRPFGHTQDAANLEAATKSAVDSALGNSPVARPLTSMQEESPSLTSLNSSGRPQSRQMKPLQDDSRNTKIAPKDETYRRAQSLLFAQRPAGKRGLSGTDSKEHSSRRSSDHGSSQNSSTKLSRSLGDGDPTDQIKSENIKQDHEQPVCKLSGAVERG